MPSTAQLSADHLARVCRFIPAAAGSGTAGRPGGRREEILAYALDVVRATPPTPIVEVEVVVDGRPRIVSLKLDGRSRWGSIKGRTALALLASAAARIGPASTIVESTSGNLGIALAGLCAEIGVPFTAVVDSRLPPAMRARIAGYGARLVCADDASTPDDSLHLLRRIARVREILDQDPGAVWTNQYENPANVAVHRWWTGHELDGQLDSGLQVMFAPVSTGGSFAGTRECLAAVRPELECVAVDVDGSTIFGGPPGPRLLTGIGASKASAFLEESPRPRHVMVSDLEAIAVCRALADDTAIAGCLRYLHGRPDLSRALCICPDLGASYQQTLYDDVWLMEHGAVEALGRPAAGGLKVVFTRLSPEWR
jgi:cysteine synthase